ncbi:MAG: nucleotide sugar dehydrogenase [Nitrososphaerota archaeon]|nr:nucleotide sugar dehydrogenase [Nitrososphaerota archaeon]
MQSKVRKPALRPADVPTLLQKGKIRVVVVGLGRIGLPTAALLAEAGGDVTGIDIRKDVVKDTSQGRCRLQDEPGLPAVVEEAVKHGRLKAYLENGDALSRAHFVLICVATPVDETKTPNYSAVLAASKTVGQSLKPNTVVIVESTVGPGIVEERVRPILEGASGFKAGEDFGLVSCPERSDPGKIVENMRVVPRIVGGLDSASTELAAALYESAFRVKVVRVRDPRTANAVKLTENLFRDVNIALANEFALLYEKLGVDSIEVINACASKYNFMPHYPGLGVGGPCVSGEEFVYLTGRKGLRVTTVGQFVDNLADERSSTSSKWGETEFFVPTERLQALSFDGRRTDFNRVSWFSRRRYKGKMVRIRLTTNRSITVTPDHPMLMKKGSEIVVRAARDLLPGDEVPISTSYGPPFHSPNAIDLIEELKASGDSLMMDVKLKPLRTTLREHQEYFTSGLKLLGVSMSRRSDYSRYDYLYLDKFVALEKWRPSPIPHERVALYTARGNACKVPAVFFMNEDFWRLIGYYASEGCIVESEEERGTRERIKISFGEHEGDLIEDCRSILESWGIKPDEEVRDGSHSLLFSSRVFAFLLEHVLECGRDSYTKKVPPQVFFSSRKNIAAFLQGLFRGDGSLEISKNGASLSQTYATSSTELFQGVLILLQAFSLLPTCRTSLSKKSKIYSNSIEITRYQDLLTLQHDVGELPKLSTAMATYYRTTKKSPAFTNYGSYGTTFVRSIQEEDFEGYVYNMEVEGAHTFATSYGIITHNCLPSNSYYLISEGIKAGNIPYIIRMAREINDRMPDHVVELVGEALNEVGKTIRGSRIAVLGVAYKPNVRDTQLTPVERMVTRLREMGAEVRLYDPMFKGEEALGLRVEKSLEAAAKGADCLVVGTAHDEFRNLDLKKLSRLAGSDAAFVDARHVVLPEAAARAGFAFRGVGRGTGQLPGR